MSGCFSCEHRNVHSTSFCGIFSPPTCPLPPRATATRSMLGLDSALKRGIFAFYVTLWVSCHLLVYQSKRAGAPVYNATSVVLLTEVVKLAMACALYLTQDGGPGLLLRSTVGSLPLLAKYAVPALLYCVYNNLVYVNLGLFDPGTYNVLMQLRIVLTGGIYQVSASRNAAEPSPPVWRWAVL